MAKGQMTKVVRPQKARQSTMAFTLPSSWSAPSPQQMRPTAEARLKPAGESQQQVTLAILDALEMRRDTRLTEKKTAGQRCETDRRGIKREEEGRHCPKNVKTPQT